MTKTEIIGILLMLMLAMGVAIMFLDRLLEKEKKNYEDLLSVHKRTLKEIERKDRLLEAWEKNAVSASSDKAVYMNGEWVPTGQPCNGCDKGWGYANSEESHTCEETCEILAAWNENQKKEADHGTEK